MPHKKEPKTRLQFSLASLLLVVTICCLSLSLWGTTALLRQARQRIHAERFETNFLDSPDLDRGKLHGGVMLASCRVLIPEGPYCHLEIQWGLTLESGGYDFNSIKSVAGYGVGGYGTGLSPGLHSVMVETNNFDNDDGKPSFIVRVSHDNGHSDDKYDINFDRGKSDCLAISNQLRAGPGVQHFTAKPGERLELFRMRLMEEVKEKQPDGKVVKYHRTPKGPTNGILIWVESNMNNKPPEPVALPTIGSATGSNSSSGAGQ